MQFFDALLIVLGLAVLVSPWVWIALRGSTASCWAATPADASPAIDPPVSQPFEAHLQGQRCWGFLLLALIVVPFMFAVAAGNVEAALAYPFCWAASFAVIFFSWFRVGKPNDVQWGLIAVFFMTGGGLGVVFAILFEGYFMGEWASAFPNCNLASPATVGCNIVSASMWILTPGLVEETSKALWLFFRLRRSARELPDTCCFVLPARGVFDCGCWYKLAPTPYHVLLCALASGAGFECIENLTYVFGNRGTSQIGTAVVRTFTSGLHMAWTGLIGFGLAQRLFAPEGERLSLLRVIAPPVVLHGLFDYSLAALGSAQLHEASLAVIILIPAVLVQVVGSYWLIAHATGCRCCCLSSRSLCCAPGFWGPLGMDNRELIQRPVHGAPQVMQIAQVGAPVQVLQVGAPQVMQVSQVGAPVQVLHIQPPPSPVESVDVELT